MPTQTSRTRGSHGLLSWLAPALGALLMLGLWGFASSDPVTLTVRVDQPGPKIDPIFYGLMTEEINYSYDGGLYGELIRNRIFQDRPIPQGRGARGGATPPASAQAGAQAAAQTPPPTPAPAVPAPPANPAVAKNPNLINWWLVTSNGAAGDMDIDAKDAVNTIALTNSLRLDIKSAGAGRRVGVANDGYWGIPIKPNTTYTASFYARASQAFRGPLTAAIEGNKGTVYASGQVRAVTTAWKKYTLKIKTGQVQATADAGFVLSASNSGSLWFSLVSLFPPTYKNRPNGNRIDIILKLVNVQASPQPIKIDLQGVRKIAKEAKGEVLTAELAAMNSVAEPTKVAPKPITIHNAGASFTHELPAHSVTVLRLKTR